MRKEDILKMLKESPELLKELLQESPELKEAIKQAIRSNRDRSKSLLDKLKRWGIEEVPQEYLENLQMIESFLQWLDETIKNKTDGKKGLHFSLRPIKKESQDQE